MGGQSANFTRRAFPNAMIHTGSHFAEGSCMNWLMMKLVFTIVPTRSPFLMRPIVSTIFGGVGKQVIDPELVKLSKFISGELKKKNGGWLAGGDQEGNPVRAAAFFYICLALTDPSSPHRLQPTFK